MRRRHKAEDPPPGAILQWFDRRKAGQVKAEVSGNDLGSLLASSQPSKSPDNCVLTDATTVPSTADMELKPHSIPLHMA